MLPPDKLAHIRLQIARAKSIGPAWAGVDRQPGPIMGIESVPEAQEVPATDGFVLAVKALPPGGCLRWPCEAPAQRNRLGARAFAVAQAAGFRISSTTRKEKGFLHITRLRW